MKLPHPPSHNTHTLPNGLRLIHEHSDSAVVYCGYVIKAGTRHEEEADSGMAHFIEHMSFKGTERRRSFHIANGLERVGGDLNAFTNKQETVYHATVLRNDFVRAAELLTDIVFRSTYPQHEIDREVEVICDEIDSYLDTPSELIFDEFESMVFAGSPLGRDILGSAERLRTYRTADALRFARKWYRPENAVFFVYGNLDFNKIVKTLEKQTHDLSDEIGTNEPQVLFIDTPASAFPPYSPQIRETHRDTHQAHVLIGARTFGGNDPHRFALLLLNNILGGPGMNSRLNMSLREKAGLVYSVDAYLSSYPDTGLWNVYFGCDTGDVERCRRLVERELRRFIDNPLTPTQLAAAKKQLKGQVGISCDASESYALALGKTYAHYGIHRNVDDILQRIDEITAADVQQTAAKVYAPEQLSTLIYR